MSRGLRITGLAVLGVLVMMQFFRPERNNVAMDPEQDMLTVLSPPEHIATMLRVACYDCHSNQTNYPWYERISPVSWYLNRHIEEGKEELNFSKFGSMDKLDRIGALTGSCDVVDATTMPLPSYLWLHKDARLSDQEREEFCIWTEKEALKAMRE